MFKVQKCFILFCLLKIQKVLILMSSHHASYTVINTWSKETREDEIKKFHIAVAPAPLTLLFD